MRAPFCFSFIAAAALAAATACSSTTVINNGPGSDAGSDGGAILGVPQGGDASTDDASSMPDAAQSGATNPYGAGYPTTNIGWKARAGNVRGDRMANLSFTGYAPSAASTRTISLADVFDPEGRAHDIVAVMMTAGWDTYSNQLATALASSPPSRVAMMMVLGEGTSPGTPATLTDLAAFRTKLPAAFHVLDPGFKTFGALFDASALPFIVVLDARTMEIVSAQVGMPPDATKALDDARTAVLSRPPAY